MFRVHAFLDVVGASYTPLNYRTQFDTLNYQQACHSMSWSGEALRVKLNGQVDVLECGLGIFGIITSKSDNNCDWQNYYVDYPVFDVSLPEFRYGGDYFTQTCYNKQ